MAVKAVVFSDRLEWVLRLLIERGAPTEGLFFRTPDGRPIHCQAASKHFKSVARRAGVELGTRTQCCLRHTYYTDLLKVIPEEDVSQPAGYTRLRKEYDHRKGVDFLRKRQRLRPAVNRLIA
jgi:hypothetical protein